MKNILLAGLFTFSLLLGVVAEGHAFIILGETFSVAAEFDPDLGDHFHSHSSGVLGRPPFKAEVGENSISSLEPDEVVRGLSEFDVAGRLPAVKATLSFDVFSFGLFDENDFPFDGTIDLIGYAGNNAEDISDYEAVSLVDIGSFSTVGLNIGDTLSFDVTTPYNLGIENGLTSLGVRLLTEDDTRGGAWTFDNFQANVRPIPEPTTVALLGIGIAGLAGVEVRRRRKKKAVDKS